MKIKKLQVSGFRGFNSCKEFHFEPGVNVFYGPNGTGKTSLSEAIEWLLFGNTSKILNAPSKIEFRDSLKNLHYHQEGFPYVEAWLTSTSSSKIYKIRRELIAYDKSNLYIDGIAAENLSEIGILDNTIVPVVAQHALKEFIHSVPADRWKTFSRMLGLENLSAFRSNLMNTITQFQNRYVGEFNRFNELTKEISFSNNSSFNGILSALENFDAKMYILELKEATKAFLGKLDKNPVLTLRNYAKQVEAVFESFSNYYLQIAISESNPEMIDNHNLMEKVLNSLEEFVTMYPKFLLEYSVHPTLEKIKFLKEGLSLPTNVVENCPFCGEPTLSTEKRKSLELEVKQYEKATFFYENLEENVSTLTTDASTLLENLKALIPPIFYDESSGLNEWINNLPQDISMQFLNVDSSMHSLKSDLVLIESEMEQSIQNLQSDFKMFHFDNNTITKITELLHKVAYLIRRLEELGKQTKKLYEECIPIIQGMSVNNEEAAKATILARLWENKQIVEKVCIANSIIGKMRKLKEDTEALEKMETELRLEQKQSNALEWYNLLNPNEEVRLSAIKVKGSKTRQVDLLAELYGKKANAAAMLSEAHINATGLSVYLSQITTLHSPFRFLILDDPVQSMDDNHSLRFQKDFVSKLTEQGYQVIILSHLKIFTDGLRALYNLDSYYEFYNYSIDGPVVKERTAELREYIKTAIEFRMGSAEHRALASNSLRKAAERLCKEIYNKQNELTTLPSRFQGMTSADLKFLIKTLISPNDLGKITTILTYTDPASHDDQKHEPPSNGTIDTMVDYMVYLVQTYVESSFKRPKVN